MVAVPAYFDPIVLTHDTGPYHPETARRVQGCVEALLGAGVRVEAPKNPERTTRAIELTHAAPYVERLRRASAMAPEAAGGRAFTLFDSPDNPLSKTTFDAAGRAVGLALAAADAVVSGRERSVFVAVRPPGHHALAARAMGFCFFNTVAVVAKDLLAAGLSRILIADFDVHHGNGTQDIFWEDERVAYLSVHRYPFYPGTGAADETGSGRGRGTTANVPLPSGSPDAVYAGGFCAALEKLTSRFHPDLVLVSAGFDAHERDPLGGMLVTTEGYVRMTESLRDVAGVLAGGRIVSLLEGGYDPAAVGEAAAAHVEALSGSH